MLCKKCNQEKGFEFYANDSTCKDCRKLMVRQNRARKIEYYRKYDRKRYKSDPKVKERHLRYQATDAGKEALRRSKENWTKANPVKRAANVILGNAVRGGKIKKPAFCPECGSTGRICGHHDDYSKPLDVRWMCQKCHTAWHKENGEAKNGR